jgi:hypothetical protein
VPIWGVADAANVSEYCEITESTDRIMLPDSDDSDPPTVGWGLLWLLSNLQQGRVVDNYDVTHEVLRLLGGIWAAGGQEASRIADPTSCA